MDVEPYSSMEEPLIDPANFFLARVNGKNVLIDAGPSTKPPSSFPLNLKVEAILLTHWHWDHVRGITWATRNARYVCASEETIKSIDPGKASERMALVVRAVFGESEESLTAMKLVVQAMTSFYSDAAKALGQANVYTLNECPIIRKGLVNYVECPGHSHDHVCYVIGDYAFVGDNMVPGSSVTLLDYRKYLDSMVKLLGEKWEVAAVGHRGPFLDKVSASRYIAEIVKGKLERLVFIAALAGKGWVSLFEVFKQVYGGNLSPKGFVAARSLVGYVSLLEELGIVKVDRSGAPWKINVDI